VPQKIDLDGKTKITISLAVLIACISGVVIGGFQSHQWLAAHLEQHLETIGKASELSAQVDKAATAAQTAASATATVAASLSMHIADEQITRARQRIDVLKGDVATTQLWEKANHPNEISGARIRDLTGEIQRTQEWVDCMQAGRSNCGPVPSG
jgi:hypothetical protein